MTVIAVAGELDIDTAPGLIRLAGRAIRGDWPYPVVVIDLSAVTFCGAAGVSALLRIRRQVAAAGGQLVVRDPSPVTTLVLAAARVLDHFYIEVSGAPA